MLSPMHSVASQEVRLPAPVVGCATSAIGRATTCSGGGAGGYHTGGCTAEPCQ